MNTDYLGRRIIKNAVKPAVIYFKAFSRYSCHIPSESLKEITTASGSRIDPYISAVSSSCGNYCTGTRSVQLRNKQSQQLHK
jgi:hypothetical protein